jgi:hypothetical protein
MARDVIVVEVVEKNLGPGRDSGRPGLDVIEALGVGERRAGPVPRDPSRSQSAMLDLSPHDVLGRLHLPGPRLSALARDRSRTGDGAVEGDARRRLNRQATGAKAAELHDLFHGDFLIIGKREGARRGAVVDDRFARVVRRDGAVRGFRAGGRSRTAPRSRPRRLVLHDSSETPPVLGQHLRTTA